MKLKKKLLSILLVVVMLISDCNNVKVAFANDDIKQDNVTIGKKDMTIEGTNSFGNLLADVLETEINEQEEYNGCNIFSIEMSDNVAIVSFETTEYATLIVGVYDETGEVMFATGKSEVLPGETSAYVEIDIDTMPDYFYIRGFLVEEDSMRPLCSSYESPNYTQEMQEFFEKTTDDFEEEKVLNLDDDKTNNFAVYSDSTIIVPQSGDSNRVTEVDEENHTYVIENIDENIENLQTNDIFTYEYGEGNVLIVKIKSISINGSTATIIGQDTSLDEVFDYVKIDKTSYTQDISVDETTGKEGVVYEGEVEVEEEVNPDIPQMYELEFEDNTSGSVAKKFEFLDEKNDLSES